MKVPYEDEEVFFNYGLEGFKKFNCKFVRSGSLVYRHGEDGLFNLLLGKIL